MKKEITPEGKMAVKLSAKDVELIRNHTFYAETEKLIGVKEGGSIKLYLLPEDIEDLQGYVAAEANHTEDAKLENALDKIAEILETYLTEYEGE